MWKDSQIKMDRADVWGDPNENGDSLLAHCQRFLDGRGEEDAHVVHMFGQGGVGKSFVCREVAGILSKDPYRERLYVVSVDLARAVSYLTMQAGFYELLQTAENLAEASRGQGGGAVQRSPYSWLFFPCVPKAGYGRGTAPAAGTPGLWEIQCPCLEGHGGNRQGSGGICPGI